MAYTDLTGENFRVAHQALKQRGEGGAVSAHRSAKQTKVLEIICVVVGILLGALLLAGAAKCGMARGDLVAPPRERMGQIFGIAARVCG